MEGINRTLVLSEIDFEKSDTLYEQIEHKIVEVLSGGPGGKKVTAGHMTVEARMVPGNEGCFINGDRKFRKEKERISARGSRE